MLVCALCLFYLPLFVGLVHRAIRPTIVMRVNSTGHIKVCDFGLSRSATAAITSVPSERADTAYLAPEQILDTSEKPAPAVDVYALGCVAVFVLCGVEPWAESKKISEIIQGVSKRGLVSTLDACVSEVVRSKTFSASVFGENAQSLLDVIFQCLSFQPESRLTAGDVAFRLRVIYRLLGGAIADPFQSGTRSTVTTPISMPNAQPSIEHRISEMIHLDDIKLPGGMRHSLPS